MIIVHSSRNLSRNLFLLTSIVGGYAYAILCDKIPSYNIGVGCPFKYLTSIPCPGCGMGRATILLIKGQFIDAILMHPLSILFNILIAMSILLLLQDIFKDTDRYSTLMRREVNGTSRIIIFATVAVCWAWNIYRGI